MATRCQRMALGGWCGASAGVREGRRRLLTTGLAAIGGGFERVVAQSGERTCGHAHGTLQPMQLIEPHASDHLSSVWCVCACAAWLIALMNPVSLLTTCAGCVP